jgi:class 3 adenylate cyclase
MESQGTPGQIQVTRATYELLRDDFVLERRGTVSVKGKGEMETWYLIEARDGKVSAKIANEQSSAQLDPATAA